MKAIQCNRFAAPSQLTYTDVDEVKAGLGEVVINVGASGVNYPDGLLVQGLYQLKPPFPFIPGAEIVGTVVEAGAGVNGLSIGDRVIGYCGLGGFAERVSCSAKNAILVPPDIPDHEAAGLIISHATAHYALKQRAQLKPGETLLVTGAAGGTGLAAVQIGKAMGARVIAACSSDDKLQMAKDNGADILINYTVNDLKSTVKSVTDSVGVDVVYDAVGGDVFDACTRCMAWNGRLLVIGFASGRIPSFPVNLALVKGYSVVGVFWGSFTEKEPQNYAKNMSELIDWYLKKRVRVVVDSVFSLKEASLALDKVLNRQVKGKVVLTPS